MDGVEIPNTNIASNLGPQIDPKDIDYLEIQRGSYAADLGDRTYGVFNVVPRTGFERDNQGELIASGGNFGQTNDYVSIGSHDERFAYYASINGNRSDLGHSNAGCADHSRRRVRLRRFQHPDFQRHPRRPVSVRLLRTA